MSKFAWIEELFANLGYAERGRRLAQAAASNPGLERAIQAAVDSGDRRQLLELLGQNIRATDPPPVRAQPAPRIVEGRPRTDDQIVQDGVREELGPVADAPMPFVRRAHEELIDAGGGEDLIERLGRASGDPALQIDLPNNTRVVSQADTAVPRVLRVPDIRRAHAQARNSWPLPYDSEADDVMQYIGEFSPAEQRVLRELEANDWLGFDYPSQAMDAVLQADGPARWEMSPGLLRARESLISPRTRPLTDGGQGFSVADILPGQPSGAPPRGFPVPFESGRELAPLGPRGMTTPSPRGLVPQGPRDLVPQSRELSVPERAVDDSPIRLEGPRQPRIEGPAQRRIEGPQQPRIEAPGVAAERNAMDDLARAVEADARRRRVPPDGDFRFEPGQRRAGGGGKGGGGGPSTPAGGKGGNNWKKVAGGIAATAAGAGAIKLGLDAMWPPLGDRDGGPTTADLAAEQNPPPEVPTREPEPIRPAGRPAVAPIRPQPPASAPPALSPREQAHALQRKLNEMRAAAGGEVPEAPAMRREIQRLFDMSDAQTNAAARQDQAPAAKPGDPLGQARQILAALNAGTIPPAQRAQAQAAMQRLYRLADEQANARTAAPPRRAG